MARFWPIQFPPGMMKPRRACFFSIHLSVDHPFFDCIPVQTVVAADLEGWNLTFVNHSIDRRLMNL
jgi:hypothetical protein